ncbi:transposase [Actinokineospora sp. NPDC004072]
MSGSGSCCRFSAAHQPAVWARRYTSDTTDAQWAIIDSQSIRAAETVRRRSRGWEAGKKVNGRKRHIAVDTLGLLLAIRVTPASTQDRAAAPRLLRLLHATGTRLKHVWGRRRLHRPHHQRRTAARPDHADRPTTAHQHLHRPTPALSGRTHPCITRHRRCARDYERHPTHHATFVQSAMIRIHADADSPNRTGTGAKAGDRKWSNLRPSCQQCSL